MTLLDGYDRRRLLSNIGAVYVAYAAVGFLSARVAGWAGLAVACMVAVVAAWLAIRDARDLPAVEPTSLARPSGPNQPTGEHQ